MGEKGAGTARTRLHFIHDEQDAVFIAQLAYLLHESRRGRNDAGLSLNGLKDDSRSIGGILLDQVAQVIRIPERVKLHSAR